jgi:C4-dicarboxylate-specific signal transduction histidine kinase
MSGTKDGLLSVETAYSEEDDNIIIRLKDSGAGVLPENISKLFEPFFTTKKKGKGVGLGLSVAYGIVKEHGGSVYVNSKSGKGTTFKISLPLKPLCDGLDQQGGPNGQH